MNLILLSGGSGKRLWPLSNEIRSKQFIEMSGLKKATFYNLLTEYKEIQNRNKQYLKQIKTV